MKFTTTAAVASLAAVSAALPTDKIDYTPKGGWGSIDWTKIAYPEGTGANLPKYPPGTGENLPSYPPATGGSNAPPVSMPTIGSPFVFTSYYEVKATPDQVVNGTTPTGGLAGASGLYRLAFNSAENVVCYNITLYNFSGDFSSPALTATHIHEAARGASGPPRIAFPNPVDIGGGMRRSIGCAQGPFRTGINGTDGQDSGNGFTVSRIEANPGAFFADVHSSLAVPGAVRGQLA
ncbi:hypothetical protein CAC42_2118 [Sphaceloma murrayae]|uniref:CHRD domain-containing protein n=1 Tax=Sphaceloma murrayae TaxID=2082308 RepID=A0A2K1QJ21_9PEZI|nr:hypothetical protein CAC42_2118 [Sphaceloma murrayae]